MEPVTLPLPPNKTCQCRELTWNPLPTRHYLAGILTVVESAKPQTKVKVRRYAVVELEPARQGFRRFQLTKPGGAEVHFTELGESFPVCQCRAAEAYGHCVHGDALHLLEKLGHLTTPKEALV